MKIVVLAAGFGGRMKPLTETTHKTMIDIGGSTIIDRIVQSFAKYPVSEFVVVTGYLADELEGYLRKQFPGQAFVFIENKLYSTTNNIHSLNLAFENIEFNEDMILIESDLIYDVQIIDQLILHSEENIALVDKYRDGLDGTVVKLSSENYINEVIPPHLQGDQFDFSECYKTLNIYKFSPDYVTNTLKPLLQFYSKIYDQNCYYELILGMLVYMKHGKIFGLNVHGITWAEVDDPNDLDTAKYVFGSDKLKRLDEAYGGFWNYKVADFCYIRNMHFPTPAILSDLKYRLDRLVHNYGSKQILLNEKMANFLLVNPNNVIALNGASQAITFLSQLFSTNNAIMVSPTFGEYQRFFESSIVLKDSGENYLARLLESIRNSEEPLVILVNPNNPTGSLITKVQMMEVIEETKKQNKQLLIDESFIDFSPGESVRETISRERLDHVHIICSLSKSLGVPGIRLGYFFSLNREIIAKMMGLLPVWNMNSLAEYFLEILLKNRTELSLSYQKTVTDREQFIGELRKLSNLKVYPSQANFILIRHSTFPVDKIQELRQKLLEENQLYIKDITQKFDDGFAYFRLAVRTRTENEWCVSLLNAAFTFFS
jgi:histidinol-phosphate/aromatic aminotransferase/cobyric acid decarboxylase-like protein/choline kinase